MRKKSRSIIREFSGSFGDLGTFLPIACGLISLNGVNGAALFFTAGALYIISGLYFRLPVPVQPLKATSALAMAVGASASSISLVCFFMAGALLVIKFLNVDKLMARLFTRPIIRGIQLGLAVILIKSGLKLIFSISGQSLFSPMNNSLGWYQVFFWLFLPQLPLTLANSIYATADTARSYFKDKADRVKPKALLYSLSAANVFSGFIGGIPLCHGSSGITAHYRFGARSGLCGVITGTLFILIAVAFKLGAGNVLRTIPLWLLGMSLVYIGTRHGLLIKDIMYLRKELSVAVFIGLYTLFFGNLAIAFSLGIFFHFVLGNNRQIFSPLRKSFVLFSKIHKP